MSVDSHVLGASTAAGGVAAATSKSNKLWIGIIVGLIVLIILGLIARKLSKRNQENEE